jgi:putative oxidoreductase
MVEFKNFLEIHHFPMPLASAVISVYAQLICGVLFIAGAYVRVAALIMIFNFIVALTAVHTHDPYSVAFPALMMLSSSLFLLFHGPGKLAIDR